MTAEPGGHVVPASAVAVSRTPAARDPLVAGSQRNTEDRVCGGFRILLVAG
jgi:hypothetical protein